MRVKLLRRAVIGLLVLVALLLAGGLLLPSTFRVSRSIEVAAPPQRVYALVADPREWKQWSVWNRRDPAMPIVYSGPASGAGATWEWKSASEGDGRMSFIAAEPPRRVAYELVFPDFGTTSHGELRLEPAPTGTRVTWTMNGDMGRNPMFAWLALFADGMVGKDFDAGLVNLKALAERG
jgi:uncharacterized protein YndB with AHSA1/START domain